MITSKILFSIFILQVVHIKRMRGIIKKESILPTIDEFQYPKIGTNKIGKRYFAFFPSRFLINSEYFCINTTKIIKTIAKIIVTIEKYSLSISQVKNRFAKVATTTKKLATNKNTSEFFNSSLFSLISLINGIIGSNRIMRNIMLNLNISSTALKTMQQGHLKILMQLNYGHLIQQNSINLK